MRVILNKKMDFLACLVFVLYFAGELVYSFWLKFGFNPEYSTLFYWINKGSFVFLLAFIFSFYIVNKQAKIIVRGGAFFLLGLAIFQCLNILGYMNDSTFWIVLCPAFIFIILIVTKICPQRTT